MKKNYTGIDCFRLIAALLIIAIHTSPLASLNETGDFILTRVIARVAVPFFMMTSGFFLISHYTRDTKKLQAFVKKMAILYGISILLYLPANLYNHYFSAEYLMPNILKDLVFDGTFYHLWYFPASILGAAAAWALVKKLDYPKALTVTGVLYIIGLFGDSYFGIAEKIPALNGFFNLVFQLSDYTRNGVFYAPFFFVLGAFFSSRRSRTSFQKSICGFAASFLLLTAEALTLHFSGIQRHDSMYFFLPPCMYFLFHILLRFRGKRIVRFRSISLATYIIHPMMIIVIRLFAKLLHLQSLLIENSLIFYCLVCAASVGFGVAVSLLPSRRKQQIPDTDKAWIEINLKNLEHNVAVLQSAMPPGCQLMAVVKDQAYGHGAFEIATNLEKLGVKAFAVATIDEGRKLRKYGIRGEILILGYTDVRRAAALKKYKLTQTLPSFAYAKALDDQGVRVKAHIKIDTGMHRLGIPYDKPEEVEKIFSMKQIGICGMYTHFCCADSLSPGDVAFTEGQIGRFYSLVKTLQEHGVPIPKLHMQSSYGLLNYPGLHCDYVRAGVALYGVLSTPDTNTVLKPDLRPVLSLKAKVVHIQQIQKGDSAGYGRSFVAQRDSRIAVLPIGYGNGYPRNLSCGKGSVIINGRQAPVIGRVCMDMLTIDITDAGEVALGDAATLIGTELPAPATAQRSETISNELLSRIGIRVPVVAK